MLTSRFSHTYHKAKRNEDNGLRQKVAVGHTTNTLTKKFVSFSVQFYSEMLPTTPSANTLDQGVFSMMQNILIGIIRS